MTQNQIRLAELKEAKRHNLISEGETERHNVITENESNRHNTVTEQQQQSQVAINDFAARETARHNLSTENETNRHNLIQEQLSQQAQNETARHNLATEVETNRANLAKESETHRSNVANELEANRANVARETETNRANLVKETETNRSNLVNERVKQYEADTHRYSNPTAAAIGTAKDIIITIPSAAKELGDAIVNGTTAASTKFQQSAIAQETFKAIDKSNSTKSTSRNYVPIQTAIGILAQFNKVKRQKSDRRN